MDDLTHVLAGARDAILDTAGSRTSVLAAGAPGSGGGGDVPTGESEIERLRPADPPDPGTGAFGNGLRTSFPDDAVTRIDPLVAVSHECTIHTSAFGEIIAPSLAALADPGGRTITSGGVSVALAAGATLASRRRSARPRSRGSIPPRCPTRPAGWPSRSRSAPAR